MSELFKQQGLCKVSIQPWQQECLKSVSHQNLQIVKNVFDQYGGDSCVAFAISKMFVAQLRTMYPTHEVCEVNTVEKMVAMTSFSWNGCTAEKWLLGFQDMKVLFACKQTGYYVRFVIDDDMISNIEYNYSFSNFFQRTWKAGMSCSIPGHSVFLAEIVSVYMTPQEEENKKRHMVTVVSVIEDPCNGMRVVLAVNSWGNDKWLLKIKEDFDKDDLSVVKFFRDPGLLKCGIEIYDDKGILLPETPHCETDSYDCHVRASRVVCMKREEEERLEAEEELVRAKQREQVRINAEEELALAEIIVARQKQFQDILQDMEIKCKQPEIDENIKAKAVVCKAFSLKDRVIGKQRIEEVKLARKIRLMRKHLSITVKKIKTIRGIAQNSTKTTLHNIMNSLLRELKASSSISNTAPDVWYNLVATEVFENTASHGITPSVLVGYQIYINLRLSKAKNTARKLAAAAHGAGEPVCLCIIAGTCIC